LEVEVEVSRLWEGWEQQWQGWELVVVGVNGWRVVVAAEVGVPLTLPPLGVHVLVHRMKLDVGEVDLADVLGSSWIGMVKLLD
jgi:hypothetical protein